MEDKELIEELNIFVNEEKCCCLEHEEMKKQLDEKDRAISNLEAKFNKLYEDFSYNVELIYERDREIEILNSRIDELITVNREKEIEIVNSQGLYSKIKQLEHEKHLLNKRIENLLAKEYNQSSHYKKFTTPTQEENSFISEFKPTHKKYLSAGPKGFHKSEESSLIPLSKINLDLERRIRALEQETDSKAESNYKRSHTDYSDQELDTSITKEKISNKEKEISELIKSLSPYKRDSSRGKKYTPKEYGLSYLSRDIEKLKAESRCYSRAELFTETREENERLRHEPAIRCTSAIDKRINNK
ncbi:hypothetical protein SteCoe_18842 [Stentor coeruleus]|uniref:Uncharacterized protein n=1 Tax=Stentor coeruleus TaxID=5963 RepID=A0A1R2BVI9_9CILI|nr:hypothetical protein SteCoe_18842 [Stentor coeruleus]